MNIQPIETQYKGYRFRSRLEARWAVFFDALGVEWEYEKEGFDMDGTKYLPDFYLPGKFKNMFIEIKPHTVIKPYKNIYLAGKIHETDWRSNLMEEMAKKYERYWITGPDFFERGHSDDDGFIVSHCLESINASNLIFANIDTTDTPGTLVELGYCAGKKEILIRFETEELAYYYWFVISLENVHWTIGGNLWDLFENRLEPLSENVRKCRKLAFHDEYRIALFQGDPLDVNITVPTGHNGDSDWGNYLSHFCRAFLERNEESTKYAAQKARSARFEFGEQG